MGTELVFVVHAHQPVGNFSKVFALAHDRCYRPFLDTLARFENIHVGLHYSGSLLEWLAENHPEFITDLRALVIRGQVEMIGGGFYEPVLSVIPEDDAHTQIRWLQDFCREELGYTPQGLWLSERVWEPDLPRLLAGTGITYTLLDDLHFRRAGILEPRITGYYVTEKTGIPLSVFPIDKALRYSIPFGPPEKVVADIATLGTVVTYGDDVEKFGLWPKTHAWVYEEKWLERFFTALSERSDSITVSGPARVLASHAPHGRIYLPTGSYEEMDEWSLLPEAASRFQAVMRAVQSLPEGDAQAFVSGGVWQNFMAKYPEANRMHKKALHVSAKLCEALSHLNPHRDERLADAQRHLYAAECNCAYWHGLFGGLYLGHLRDAVYQRLIAAEMLLDTIDQGDESWIGFEEKDYDCDLYDEVIAATDQVALVIDPAEGGCLHALDFRPALVNLCNALTRRPESYHRNPHGSVLPPDGQVLQGAHLLESVPYDCFVRGLLIDQFYSGRVTSADLEGSRVKPLNETLRYSSRSCAVDEEGDYSFGMLMEAVLDLATGPGPRSITIEKRLRLPIDRAALEVSYRLRNNSAEPAEFTFVSESTLNLLAPRDEKCSIRTDDDSPQTADSRIDKDSIHALEIRDELRSMGTRIELAAPVPRLCLYPVETVSHNEEGLERTYQGSAFAFAWQVALAPGEEKELALNFLMRVLEEPAQADERIEDETSIEDPSEVEEESSAENEISTEGEPSGQTDLQSPADAGLTGKHEPST